MLPIVNSVLVAYLAGTGAVANASIVTRGLLRAIQCASAGRFHAAGIEALAAISAPTVLAFTTTASMVHDVVDGAFDLLSPAFQHGDARLEDRAAA